MFVVDENRNILFANDSFAKMFGYTIEEVINVNTRKFHLNDESYEEFATIAFDAVSKGNPVDTEFEVKRKDGSFFWIHIVGSLVENEKLILWTMFDITKSKKVQDKIKEINYNFEAYLNAIDKIDIGIFVVNEDFSIRYMNNTMKKWFGNQIGKICYSAVANLGEPCPYCKLYDVINDNKNVIYNPSTPDGQSFNIIATSIKNSDGSISKMEIIRNVTKQKQADEMLLKKEIELNYQAHYDMLTGLPNRVLFNDRLKRDIKISKIDNKKLALLFLDLDYFKEINDSLGHNIGDEVLVEVTKRLIKVIKVDDTLARLGGDEFTIIVNNLIHGQEASILAQKILESLKKPVLIKTHKLYISSSIGISLYPDDGDDYLSLLKYADAAMYKAKNEGRGNYQFYSSEMTELAFERLAMETSFRSSLENKDFLVYYQPQVDGETEKLIGMEALVRWNHPSMGIVPPSKFIPLAETTGLIVELDRFVMKTAMQQVSAWRKKNLKTGVLSLNLSVKQLHQKDFIEVLKSLMNETKCDAKWIELEVTESQVMSNPQEAIKILESINSLGIGLSIDDFGTGYSSLSYLKKLPIQKLKIDQSFVRDLPDDEEDSAITKAVIALGKSLNLDIIAEGVETKEQKDFLVNNGCKNIQGYYYARPMPTDKMELFLSK
jgi:diguanylate cyclase (GGDEF)-like protein/PAS domain S-box-containing protein